MLRSFVLMYFLHEIKTNFWPSIAERCLKAYRRLSLSMRQMDQDPLYMKDVVIPDFANNLQARI